MKLAIMQPYLFPYIGYFQLIAACDTFVFYDDVQFMKGGWINRNRIWANDKDEYITLKVKADSTYSTINQRVFSDEFEDNKSFIIRKLQNNYRKAPYYKNTIDLVNQIFEFDEISVSKFIAHSIVSICNYLQLPTAFISNSSLNISNTIAGQERVIQICKQLKATEYINAIGGFSLYNTQTFQSQNINLLFLQPNNIQYTQSDKYPFIPWLSIIDVLMFNDIDKVKSFLSDYKLISNA
jgi:WbqC-like protein family